MVSKYKIIKDNFFVLIGSYNNNGIDYRITIRPGYKFHHYIIDKNTLKNIRHDGYIIDISDDGILTVDISTRYNSKVRKIGIWSFIQMYLGQEETGYQSIRPEGLSIIEDKDIVIKKDNYLLFDLTLKNTMIKEGNIVKNTRTGNRGRLFDLKIDMDRKTISYKLDGSIDGCSDIYEFNDDFSFDDDMIVAYLPLENSPDD